MHGHAATLALTAVLAVAAPAAAADDSVVLTRDDVPGFKAAGMGGKTGREALGNAVRGGRASGSAFKAGRRQLSSGVMVLSSSSKAKATLKRAGRGGRQLKRIGDGARLRTTRKGKTATATVWLRVGRAIGAVRLTVPAAQRKVLSGHTTAYAGVLAARLERILNRTAWDRVLEGIRPDGSVPPRVALQAFALAYGDLPGVKRPKGRAGEVHGTTATSMVMKVWDRLNQAQRTAIGAVIAGSNGRTARASKLTPDAGYTNIAEAFKAKFTAALAQVIAPPPMDDHGNRQPPSYIPQIKVFRSSTPSADAGVLADAHWLELTDAGVVVKGAPVRCRIRVFPSLEALGPVELRAALGHEVFHCFQFSMMNNGRHPPWLQEGLASWASLAVEPVKSKIFTRHYKRYLARTYQTLFQHEYEALGFWMRLAEQIGHSEVWKRVPVLLTPGAEKRPSSDLFDAAIATAPNFVETWASSMWRLGPPAAAWFQTQPYVIPFSSWFNGFKVVGVTSALTSKPHGVTQYLVQGDPTAPLVDLAAQEGVLRLIDGDKDLGEAANGELLCISTCKCPEGEAFVVPFTQIAGPLRMALTGGGEAGTAKITYHTAREYCKPTPDPTVSDVTVLAAGSDGDPHLFSFDGLDFDFQAAGEFVLARSGSDLEVQARQVPLVKNRNVTVNSQVAMRVATARVAVSAVGTGQPPAVRVNGAAVTLATGEARVLGAGASVARAADGRDVIVVWADGSKAEVRPVAAQGLGLTLRLAPARRGKAVGMLGDFDGNPRDDLRDRAGRRMSYVVQPQDSRVVAKEEFSQAFTESLYKKVGESWRISQAESLFHYEPGQSTATFTDRSVPRRILNPDDLEGSDAAERVCRERGVTDRAVLQNCILDLVLTGDPAYADDAAISQQARSLDWTALAADTGAPDASLRGVSTAIGPDGVLHVAFRRHDALVNVPLDPFGRAAPAEVITTVGASQDNPVIMSGPAGTITALYTQTHVGLLSTQRAGAGSWSPGAPVSGRFVAGLERPTGVITAAGLQVSALSVAGVTGSVRMFVGTGDESEGIPVGNAACSVQSPAVAIEPASGAVFVAWIQARCDQRGVYIQQFDPAQRAFVGPTGQAPNATWTSANVPTTVSLGSNEHLALAARPGQPGLFLAYPTDDGSNIRVWRVGAPSATTIPKRAASIRRVRLTAEPSGGRMWLAWLEADETARIRVQRLTNTGTDGPVLDADSPTPGTSANDIALASRQPNTVDILADTGNRIHHATIR